jgi:hypothetical protein
MYVRGGGKWPEDLNDYHHSSATMATAQLSIAIECRFCHFPIDVYLFLTILIRMGNSVQKFAESHFKAPIEFLTSVSLLIMVTFEKTTVDNALRDVGFCC